MTGALRSRGSTRDWDSAQPAQQPQGFPKTVARAAEQVRALPIARGVAHHRSPASCSKERRRTRSLRKPAQNSFPTLKKKDEALGAHRHHPCSVDADAAPCTRQCIRQTVLLIMPSRHRRDANSMAWRCDLSPLDSASTAACTRPLIHSRAGPGRRQAAQNDLREQPEVGPGGGEEGQGLLQ